MHSDLCVNGRAPTRRSRRPTRRFFRPAPRVERSHGRELCELVSNAHFREIASECVLKL
jgi:hypothetical protein